MNTSVKNEGNKAKEQVGQAADKAREAAGHVGEAASSAAGAVGQVAQQAASAVGHQAEKATAAVGGSAHYAADKVRENLPNEGMVGQASRAVADGLDSAGKYIEDKNLTGMLDDVTGIIKRNPVPAVLIGLGIGFLIGRVLSSSSSSNRSWS